MTTRSPSSSLRRSGVLALLLPAVLWMSAPPAPLAAQEAERAAVEPDRGGRSGRGGAEAELLARELAEARRRAVVGEVEVERLRQRVLELEGELAALRGTPRGGGDALEALDPYDPPDRGGEVVVEDSPPSAAPPPTIEVEEIDDPLESALPDSATNPDVPASEGTPGGRGGSDSGVRVTANDQPPSAEALDLYDRGYALFHQERYRQAEDLFLDYIARFPQTELADNALFWVGECRWAREEYAPALDAFAETVTRFPVGNKVPDALLKAGKCLEALGRREQAVATYHELVERYPGTLASINAEERLRGLEEAGRAQPRGR